MIEPRNEFNGKVDGFETLRHDAMPFYRYFESKGTSAFIDLNKRQTGNKKYKDTLTVSPQGVPICQKGLPMKDNDYDRSRGRRKFR